MDMCTWIRAFSVCLLGISAIEANAVSREPIAQPEPRLHVSFAGTQALLEREGLEHLDKIAKLPGSEDIGAVALGKAVKPVAALLSADRAGDAREMDASLLKPLLRDWAEVPSRLEVWGAAPESPIWLLALQLSDKQADHWHETLRQLLESGQSASALSLDEEGHSGWEIKLEAGMRVFRFIDVGDWTLLYEGPDQWPVLDRAVAQWSASSETKMTPSTPLLSGETDLSFLEEGVGFPDWLKAPPFGWPTASFQVTVKDGRFRTTVDLDFPKPMGLEMGSWQVPTNTINDPLISFSAGRGLSRWLKRLPKVADLSFDPIPNQVFTWAQADTPFQSYAIFPATNVTEGVKRLTKDIQEIARPFIEKRQLGNIAWRSERGETQWRGLPFVVPFLRPVDEPAGQFIQVGMFPSIPDADPFPDGLLKEVQGREELVYYSWEITEWRLKHWRAMMQLKDLILFDPQARIKEARSSGDKEAVPSPRPPALKATGANQWVDAIASHLGNTVTEARRASPRRLRLVRTSHIGLTGLELMQLIRWLDPGMAASSSTEGVGAEKQSGGRNRAPSSEGRNGSQVEGTTHFER